MSTSSTKRVRVQRPERQQIEWRPAALDQMVPADHRVRSVWAYVDALDLSSLYEGIHAVEGGPGRDAVDPKILLALWMYATIEAVSSARHLERLCERDLPYLWICGGVGVNYHLLSDFRTRHGDWLDQLLTDTIATLIHQKIVTLETVAQDGLRTRAHAGSSSFRRQPTLERCREAAAEQVRRLREEREQTADTAASDARRTAARDRAARERLERVEQALAELPLVQAQKERKKKGSGGAARCSTTDPEARKMKMADGGCRPAYNVQFGTDGGSRMIVAVDVINNGSDGGQMAPLHETIRRRYGRSPEHYLVDGGFISRDDVTSLEQRGSQVCGPVTGAESMLRKGVDPHAPQPQDTQEMAAFRQRMATDAAQTRYQQRPSIAEFPNAECRNRGLTRFRVRGLRKVRAVTLLHAITFNFLRMLNLGCLTATTAGTASPPPGAA